MKNKVKEPKKKPPYSVWQNIRFVFSNMWKWDKAIIFMNLLCVPINVILPLLGIYMTRYVIDIVTTQGSIERLLLYILIFSLSMLALNFISTITGTKLNWRTYYIRQKYLALVNEKFTDADYENIENPDVQIKFEKAFTAVQQEFRGIASAVDMVISMLTNLTGFITFGAIIFGLNPFIIILISATAFGDYFIYGALHSWDYRNRDNWTPIDRKLSYIQRSAGDFSRAKDIRLYSISQWFTDLFASILKERLWWLKKYKVRQLSADIVIVALSSFVREGISYAYLIYVMIATNMPVSYFVLYFGIIRGFYTWVLQLIYDVLHIRQISLLLCDLREFLELPDKSNRGKGIDLPSEACEIEFKNVSYRYTQSENYTIENLSFKINKGEKIAIVGLNGAGKTTMVKLMCGLYRPTEGEILVGGKNIMEYNRDEYYTLFSAVFQDIYLMPVSIAKNISLQSDERIENNKVAEMLELSGLYDKVSLLPKGTDTSLLKSFSEEAVELSGGETQKLALSRALYKDGKIIVLDEPTAALDPIAENEMYQKYNELTLGRTSVYVSHRLSSTRFCDRIFFLEDGKIIESGSHNELMKKGGKYTELFDIQSHYYKENTVNIENTESIGDLEVAENV